MLNLIIDILLLLSTSLNKSLKQGQERGNSPICPHSPGNVLHLRRWIASAHGGGRGGPGWQNLETIVVNDNMLDLKVKVWEELIQIKCWSSQTILNIQLYSNTALNISMQYILNKDQGSPECFPLVQKLFGSGEDATELNWVFEDFRLYNQHPQEI